MGNPAKKARQGIRNCINYFSLLRREIQREIETEVPHLYLVDFDCIRHYAEFRLTRSVYAASTMAAFVRTSKADHHLFIPPGSRSELSYFIASRINRRTFPSNNELVNQPVPDEGKDGIYRSTENVPWERKLYMPRRVEKALHLLDVFFRQFSAPFSESGHKLFPHKAVSRIRETAQFKKTLAEIEESGREGSRRNQADAANIATLDIALDAGIDTSLVTGTRLVAKIRPSHTVDPVYLLLSMDLRSKYPDLSAKSTLLDQIDIFLERLHSIYASLVPWEGAFDAKDRGYRLAYSDLQRFREQLRQYRSDSVVGSTVRLLTNSQTDSETRLELLERELSKDIKTPGFHSEASVPKDLSRAISLLEEAGKETEIRFEDLGYEWKPWVDFKSYARRTSVLDGTDEEVLVFEVHPHATVISWPTNSPFSTFANSVREKITDAASVEVILNYPDKPSETITINNIQMLRKTLFSGTRIISKDCHLIYTVTDEECESSARISAIVKMPDTALFDYVYLHTFKHFVPPTLLRKAVEENSRMGGV